MSATIFNVAALAGVSVVHGAKAVARIGTGGSDYPGLFEKGIADEKAVAFSNRNIRRGQGIGLVAGIENGSSAAAAAWIFRFGRGSGAAFAAT